MLTEKGYAVTHGILNAVDFGVPQNRCRLFVVGHRGRKVPDLPKPGVQSRVTVRDAIHDLPKLANGASADWLPYRRQASSGYGKQLRQSLSGCSNHLVTRNASHVIHRYAFVPPGGNWESIPERLMRNYTDRSRCHTGIYHRLHYDRPSVVIGNFRKNMLIHPHSDRGLSVRETCSSNDSAGVGSLRRQAPFPM